MSGPAAPAAPLRGLRVLVTRPAAQARGLSQRIGNAGGLPLELPAIAISPPSDQRAARAALARLPEYQIAIFLSVNAVTAGLHLAREMGVGFSKIALLAVGEASARRLRTAGLRAAHPAAGASGSEGLLALPQLQAEQVRGRRVLILKGEGGRELLGPGLVARGAEVTSAALYRRAVPAITPEALRARFAHGGPDVAIATSGEALENLAKMLRAAGLEHLLDTPVVVVSERLEDIARSQGFANLAGVAAGAADEDITRALIEWAESR